MQKLQKSYLAMVSRLSKNLATKYMYCYIKHTSDMSNVIEFAVANTLFTWIVPKFNDLYRTPLQGRQIKIGVQIWTDLYRKSASTRI